MLMKLFLYKNITYSIPNDWVLIGKMQINNVNVVRSTLSPKKRENSKIFEDER